MSENSGVGLHKLHCIEMLNGVADTVKAVLTKPPWEQLLCAEQTGALDVTPMDNKYLWSLPNFHCKDLKSHCNL